MSAEEEEEEKVEEELEEEGLQEEVEEEIEEEKVVKLARQLRGIRTDAEGGGRVVGG